MEPLEEAIMFFRLKLKSLFFLTFITSPAFAEEKYIFNNVQILTFENNFDPYLGHVIVNNNKIEVVEFGTYSSKNKKTKIIDCKKQYLLPGLIDSHVHTLSIPGMIIAQENNKKNKTILDSYKNQIPKSYLYYGFTTIVDLSLNSKKISPIYNQVKEHPQLIISGGPLVEKAGYPLNYSEKNENFHIITSNAENYKEQIDKSIDKIILNDGKILKLFYENGFGKNDRLPNLNDESLKYSIDLAHSNKIPVIIHANSLAAYKNTIHMKHDGYAHGLWRWDIELEDSSELPKEVTDILDIIIMNKIAYQPTTQVVHGLYLLYDDYFLERNEIAKVIPRKMLDWLKVKNNQVLANEIKSELTKEQAFRIFSNGQKTLQYIAKSNGLLLFGTDTPSAPIHTNLPGYNGYLEMLNWSKAGVTNKQILMAATIDNAKFLKLEESIGSIAVHKTANLIILDKNPLENIENLNSIQKVILNGKIIPRNNLSVKN